MAKPIKISRRGFINLILGGSLLGWLTSVFYPIFKFLNPPVIPEAMVTSVKLGSASEFPFNSGKIFKFGKKPGILIRTVNGEFRAFSAVCTHLDCIVQYRPDLEVIWCACHNGKYNLNGINIAGPPPRPLDPYKVMVVGDEIVVTKEA
ncbi:MAG: ubiquinol-cytochrome c reductase iron-sulfur subunit [Fidelibacterota bacterium]